MHCADENNEKDHYKHLKHCKPGQKSCSLCSSYEPSNISATIMVWMDSWNWHNEAAKDFISAEKGVWNLNIHVVCTFRLYAISLAIEDSRCNRQLIWFRAFTAQLNLPLLSLMLIPGLTKTIKQFHLTYRSKSSCRESNIKDKYSNLFSCLNWLVCTHINGSSCQIIPVSYVNIVVHYVDVVVYYINIVVHYVVIAVHYVDSLRMVQNSSLCQFYHYP